jgi:hypothetical protein
MSSSQPTIENLLEIKNMFEQKMNESSDSDYTTDDSTSSSSTNKKSKNIDYKSKFNNLESRVRYMQLEMVNKDIEITELKNKLNDCTKIDELFTKTNYLFERLDNAYKVLNTRINSTNDDNYIKFNMINDLTTAKDTLKKVQDKYKLYINNEVYPLIDTSNIYYKNAITALYDIKEKEFKLLTIKIDDKIYNANFYNTLWIFLSVVLFAILLQIIIISCCYLFGYLN